MKPACLSSDDWRTFLSDLDRRRVLPAEATWRIEFIPIPTDAGLRCVRAETQGPFAVHPKLASGMGQFWPDRVTLTHLPTGLSVATFFSSEEAKAASVTLAGLTDWWSLNPEPTPETRAVLLDLRARVTAVAEKHGGCRP